jgi:16S rRNA (adenine1518-N6/adenine1519-N6)-dimethyltransferase
MSKRPKPQAQRRGRASFKPSDGSTAPRTGKRPPLRKRFGQHFLAAAWAERVVAATQPMPGDVFLEIGPGSGALTLPLARHGAPILAVEIDRDLVAELLQLVPPHVTVMSGDILKTDFVPILTGLEPQRPIDAPGADMPARRFRVVGNLPYYIASPILFKLIELHRQHALFADATVMVQREVADRLAAKPGTRDYGVLTVMLAVHARISRVLDLPPGAFSPPPKVRSSVVRLEFGEPTVKIRDEALFERMVKALFGQRRKTVSNALKAFDATAPALLALAGIDGRRRPETLQVQELAKLAEMIAAVRQGQPVL